MKYSHLKNALKFKLERNHQSFLFIMYYLINDKVH
jgi:hypothetical protein